MASASVIPDPSTKATTPEDPPASAIFDAPTPAPAAPTTSSDPPFSTPTPAPAPTPSSKPPPPPAKSTHKPFPAITGSCTCSTLHYRLLTSPLFVYACHCPDCQKLTGSAFGLYLTIERAFIQVLSTTQPVPNSQSAVPVPNRPQELVCPVCRVAVWSVSTLNGSGAVGGGGGDVGDGVVDVRVGTLDFPGLMEPDIHAFTESKLDWVGLPADARVVGQGYNYKEVWPKSSLRRLERCLAAGRQGDSGDIGRREVMEGDVGRSGGEVEGDGDKTPTAGIYEGGDEDEEAFERRVREMERGLGERLERLERKLEEEGKGGKEGKGMGEGKGEVEELERGTKRLEIG